MALTFTGVKPQPRDAWGQLSVRIMDITLDGSYAAGGYAVTPQQAGFGQGGVIVYSILPEINGYSLEWVPATAKLKVLQNGAGSAPNAEVANNAAGINGLVARVLFLGYGVG
jgi:hypothetical protein